MVHLWYPKVVETSQSLYFFFFEKWQISVCLPHCTSKSRRDSRHICRGNSILRRFRLSLRNSRAIQEAPIRPFAGYRNTESDEGLAARWRGDYTVSLRTVNNQEDTDPCVSWIISARAMKVIMPFEEIAGEAPQKEQYLLYRSEKFARRGFTKNRPIL